MVVLAWSVLGSFNMQLLNKIMITCHVSCTSTLNPCLIHPSSGIRIILIFNIKTNLISALEFLNTQEKHLTRILGRIGLPNPYPKFTRIRITYPVLKYSNTPSFSSFNNASGISRDKQDILVTTLSSLALLDLVLRLYHIVLRITNLSF